MKIGRFSSSVVAWGALLVSFSFDKPCEAQSVPTPSPTNACIPVTQSAIIQCLEDSNLDVGACNDCYAAYLDLVVFGETTCVDANSIICNQIDTCTSSCGTCGSFIEEYETCNYGSDCFLGCSPGNPTPPSFPSSPVAPAPSPSAVTTSPQSEIDALSDCITASGADGASCYSCLNDYYAENITTCDDVELYSCTAMETCPECGSCEAENTALDNCFNEGLCTAFSCSAPAPAPDPTASPVPTSVLTTSAPSASPTSACEEEYNALMECATTSGEGAESCISCLAAYVPDYNITCEAGDRLICSAMDSCPECGNCQAEFVILQNCFNQDSTCPSVTCPASSPTAAPTLDLSTPGPVGSPPSPVSAPVPSPTSGGDDNGGNGNDDNENGPDIAEERCPSQLDNFKDCLATELSSSDAASCESCVSDALDGLVSTARQSASCGPVIGAICPALIGGGSGECECGACTNSLLSYLVCTVDALTTGCELKCDGFTPSQSTSGAATSRRLATIVGVAAGMAALASSSWMGLV